MTTNKTDNLGKEPHSAGFWRASACIAAIASAFTTLPSAVHAQDDDGEEGDVIVVRGIRSSIAQSIQTKRDSANIVDALTAEDIGEFPDQNVAESLQRITGVAIDRERGEGALVSIRGLGPQFVRVSINGRTAPSNVDGTRAFSFDQLQAEIVQALEVYKTPQADLVDGGLAGTINVKTRRPLDLGRRVISGSALATYNTLSENTAPRISGLFSDTYADGRFGFLISGSFDDRTLREDSVDVTDYQVRNFDLDDDGIDEVGGFFPGNLRAFLVEEDRQRINITSAAQWRPNDQLDVSVDFLYASFEEEPRSNRFVWRTQTGIANNARQVEAEGDVITFFETVGARPRTDSQIQQFESEQVNIGGNVDYQATDRFSIAVDLSFSENEVDFLDRRTFYDQGPTGVTYDIRDGNFIPAMSIDQNLVNPDILSQGLIVRDVGTTSDQEFQGRVDVTYELDTSFVTAIRAGLNYRDRERAFQTRGIRLTTFRGEPLTDVNFSDIPYNNFLTDINAPGWPTTWVAADVEDVFQTYLVDRVDEIPESVFEAESNAISQDYVITEETVAGYLMADLDGMIGGIPVSGNAGLRIVNTEQVSTGNVQPIIDFVIPNGGTAPEFVFGDAAPESVSTPYTEYLPSVNLTFELRDDVLLRVAGSKVLTRPNFVDLNPGTASANPSVRSIVSGNPNLEPLTAWQADTSFEWYLSDSSIIAVAGFGKWVDSFITVVTTLEEFIDPDTGLPLADPDDPSENLTLSRTAPRNEDGAFIGGIELNVQQTFDFLPGPFAGFGGQFNYTWVTTDAEFINPNNGVAFDVPGLSEHTVNVVGFYEAERWSARLAFNRRGEFLNNISDTRGNPRLTKAFNQLDGSFNYNVNDNVTFVLEAINLTNENREDFNQVGDSSTELLRFVNDTGRKFITGVRVNF